MENNIKEIINKCFGDNKHNIVYRLMGGMSNYTYLVNVNDKLYTVRYPGEYAEHFVNRDYEEDGIKLFEKLGLTNKTIYLDKEAGTKVSEYTVGRSLNELKNNKEDLPYKDVSILLKQVHNSGLKAINDYEPFKRLKNYEKDLLELGYILPDKYLEIKKEFCKYQNYLESQNKVLCHNDSQPSNFILDDGGKLFVVDFEFTGMNDPIYDISCFANMEIADGEKLLDAYFVTPTNDEKKRFYLWRSFQCFQWFNVAMFKELVGMSKTLKLDFNAIAMWYLQEAENNLLKATNF